MKTYKHLLFAALLIIFATSHTKAQTKPLPNYTFSHTELTNLLDERQQILTSMRVNYRGNTYDTASFADTLDDNQMVVRLKDSNDNRVDLILSSDDNSDCVIYRQGELLDAFKCDGTVRSTSNEKTLIQSTTQKENQPILVEFDTEAIQYMPNIGSTILTVSKNCKHIDIKTSFAFNDLYKNALGITPAEGRINSTLGMTTFLQLSAIVRHYPRQKLVLKFNNNIGGSADDDINMYTGLMIHNHRMTTVVTPMGSVFSGGTDLFAAGTARILQRSTATDHIEINRQIGVHSWSDGQKTATEIPYTDESHRKQATYFKTMLGNTGIDFYIFTLNSAPFDGEHWITKAESDKYGLITLIE